jgi:hypothetical protein
MLAMSKGSYDKGCYDKAGRGTKLERDGLEFGSWIGENLAEL